MAVTKRAFTIVEALISMLIISVIGIGITFLLSNYYKTAYSRDVQIKALIDNVNTIEQIKANVHSIEGLYNATYDNDNIRVIAVGVGEVVLLKKVNGDIEIIKSGLDESYVFQEKLKIKHCNIFRLEIGNNTPNSSLIAIIFIGGDGS